MTEANNGLEVARNRIREKARGKIIVLEGMDGVGKTTLAKNLADRLDGEYLHTSLTDEETQLVANMNPFRRFRLYMEQNAVCSQKAEELKNIGVPVIIDRFLLTTFAYQNILANQQLTGRGVDFFNFLKTPSSASSWVVNFKNTRWDLVYPDLQIFINDPNDLRYELYDEERTGHEKDNDFLDHVGEEYKRLVCKTKTSFVNLVKGEDKMVGSALHHIEEEL